MKTRMPRPYLQSMRRRPIAHAFHYCTSQAGKRIVEEISNRAEVTGVHCGRLKVKAEPKIGSVGAARWPIAGRWDSYS